MSPNTLSQSFIRRFFLAAAALMLFAATSGAEAQSVTAEFVKFPRGKTEVTLAHDIRGNESWLYVIKAQKGDRLRIDMQGSNPSAYFNVQGTGRNSALHIGSVSGNSFNTVLTASDDYQVTVYLSRNAARRGENSENRIRFRLAPTETTPDKPFVQSDYWEIHGLKPNQAISTLSLRNVLGQPVSRVANGSVVRNLGCLNDNGVQWCIVRLGNAAPGGWIQARYLKPVGQTPARPSVPAGDGRPFAANGKLPCSPTLYAPKKDCAYGVIYGAKGGTAKIWIDLGKGRQRMIQFVEGVPTETDSTAPMNYDLRSRGYEIRVGNETFSVAGQLVDGK